MEKALLSMLIAHKRASVNHLIQIVEYTQTEIVFLITNHLGDVNQDYFNILSFFNIVKQKFSKHNFQIVKERKTKNGSVISLYENNKIVHSFKGKTYLDAYAAGYNFF